AVVDTGAYVTRDLLHRGEPDLAFALHVLDELADRAQPGEPTGDKRVPRGRQEPSVLPARVELLAEDVERVRRRLGRHHVGEIGCMRVVRPVVEREVNGELN